MNEKCHRKWTRGIWYLYKKIYPKYVGLIVHPFEETGKHLIMFLRELNAE